MPSPRSTRRGSTASTGSIPGARHISCEGCRSRKMRCSRTTNCKGCQQRGIECVWNGSAPSRTSEEVTIDEQEREIQRLNRLVRELRKRIRKLGGKEEDLVLTETDVLLSQSAALSLTTASSPNKRAPNIDPQSYNPPSSTASSSSLPSPAASFSSADFSWAVPPDASTLSLRRGSDLRFLPECQPSSSRRSSLQRPPFLVAGPPRSAPPTPYVFPAPSSTPTATTSSQPPPSSAYPFPLPTRTSPSPPFPTYPTFPTSFFPPAPGPPLRLTVSTADLATASSAISTSAHTLAPAFPSYDPPFTRPTTSYADDYFTVAGFEHIRKRVV